jgi:hypothetical protein
VPIDIRVSSYNSNLDVGHDVSGSSLEVPLTPSYYSDSSSYTETNIDSNNTENVIPKFAEELKKSATPTQRQRRKLVRQKGVSESPPAVDKCILLNLPIVQNCLATKLYFYQIARHYCLLSVR